MSSGPPKPQEPGVPEKLLREFVKKSVTVDTSTGELFVGTLVDVEENMNMSLANVKATFPSGVTTEMKSVYIKGSKVRYIGLPPEAKDSVRYLANQAAKSRGRGGFRGGRGRGGGRGGGGGRGFDRHRY